MARNRTRTKQTEAPFEDGKEFPYSPTMDVNAVVSYNLRVIRERRGMTQLAVAQRLAAMTGHQLPQASISAMERGFDGERRRRFDAHELYLLSRVFDVPIAYFFLPPSEGGGTLLTDTNRPVEDLYMALLGTDEQLPDLDERLADINIKDPATVDRVLAGLFGAEAAANNWHDHFRTWRKKRLVELAKTYGDDLDQVAEVLGRFAEQIKVMGPQGYLQSKAHRPGEEPFDPPPGED